MIEGIREFISLRRVAGRSLGDLLFPLDCLIEHHRQPHAGLTEPPPHYRQVYFQVGICKLLSGLEPFVGLGNLLGLPGGQETLGGRILHSCLLDRCLTILRRVQLAEISQPRVLLVVDALDHVRVPQPMHTCPRSTKRRWCGSAFVAVTRPVETPRRSKHISSCAGTVGASTTMPARRRPKPARGPVCRLATARRRRASGTRRVAG